MKKEWRNICDEYLKAFCDKHGFRVEDAYWIGDDPGTMAHIADYYIDMDDLRYDIDNDIEEGVFFEWYDFDDEIRELEQGLRAYEHISELKHIGYQRYCISGIFPYTEEEIEGIRKRVKRILRRKTGVFDSIRMLDPGHRLVVPISRWAAARSAASTLSRRYGIRYRVRRTSENEVTVYRLA